MADKKPTKETIMVVNRANGKKSAKVRKQKLGSVGFSNQMRDVVNKRWNKD